MGIQNLSNMCDTNDEQPLEQQTYYSRVIPIVELDWEWNQNVCI